MRTHWATVTDGFRDYVWEVVDSVNELTIAFDAVAESEGVDVLSDPVADARETMVSLARAVKVSTVGDVLQVELARQMLRDALTSAGLGAVEGTLQ